MSTLYAKKNGKYKTNGHSRLVVNISGGTDDYEQLENKPSINAVTLVGNKTGAELGLQDDMDPISAVELAGILT